MLPQYFCISCFPQFCGDLSIQLKTWLRDRITLGPSCSKQFQANLSFNFELIFSDMYLSIGSLSAFKRKKIVNYEHFILKVRFVKCLIR